MTPDELFDFDADTSGLVPGVIRLKGSRIDIAHVIERHRIGQAAEWIAANAFGRPFEPAYIAAVIAYYEANREAMDAYMTRRDEIGARYEAEARAKPPTAAMRRILAIKAARGGQGEPGA